MILADTGALRVLSVSPSVVGGGAEKVVLDLHQGYLQRGVDSWLAVASANAEAPNLVRIPVDRGRSAWAGALLASGTPTRHPSSTPPPRLRRVLAEPSRYARVGRGFEDFEFPWTQTAAKLVEPEANVLQLHNVHGGYFDIRALPGLSAATPTAWTLHDAWALTGHCAYPIACDRWRTGCGSCPDLDRYVRIRRDESAANWCVKREALKESSLAFVAPSAWLAEMVETAGVVGPASTIDVIPNGVDTSVFAPGDRAQARTVLGISDDRTVLLFAARGLTGSVYKGFGTLSLALEMAAGRGAASNMLFIALGADAGTGSLGGVEARFVPFVDDADAVATYLRAADVYVHPACAENFPLAILEAMACGTPVIASNVGGIPEMVVDGETGSLVPSDDARALAASIAELVGDAKLRERMGAAAARRVAERYSLDRQVDAYLALYARMRGGNGES